MTAAPATLFVCLLTAGVSLLAFRRPEIIERLLFRPERILAYKEWYRLFSSALVHAGWMHLGFNLLALYTFGEVVELIYGAPVLLGIYLGSVLGGSLLSLFLHRHHDYAALGASGGVCGVVFASIFLVPGVSVAMLLLPISLPGPVFAVLYLAGTFVALRREIGHIGHDAHFGGAIVGLALALVIAPAKCLHAPVLFVSAFVFAGICLYVLACDPTGLSGRIFSWGRPVYRRSPNPPRSNDGKRGSKEEDEGEVDRLLEKIARSGMDSLTKKERARLQRASAKFRHGPSDQD